MLFSMLHYSISQSNNSIFVHQRTVSCLIVCGCFLPTYLLGPSLYPFAAFLCILLGACNHGDGSLFDQLCSALEVEEPISIAPSLNQKRMTNGRAPGVKSRACQLAQEVGFLLTRLLSRNCRPVKSGEKNTESRNWYVRLALCLLPEDLERPPLWSPLGSRCFSCHVTIQRANL